MISASVTICEVIWSLMDQPATRRGNRSMAAATENRPSEVRRYVTSATFSLTGDACIAEKAFLVRAIRLELSLRYFRSHGRPRALVFRRTSTPGAGADGRFPHQSLDAMLATGVSIFEKTAPGAAGSIGSAWSPKAHADTSPQRPALCLLWR